MLLKFPVKPGARNSGNTSPPCNGSSALLMTSAPPQMNVPATLTTLFVCQSWLTLKIVLLPAFKVSALLKLNEPRSPLPGASVAPPAMVKLPLTEPSPEIILPLDNVIAWLAVPLTSKSAPLARLMLVELAMEAELVKRQRAGGDISRAGISVRREQGQHAGARPASGCRCR